MNDRPQSRFDFRTEADFYESGVLRTYRSFLIWCGLWPYESFKLKQARRIVCSMSLVSIILVQIFILFTRNITLDLLLDITPGIIFFIIVMVKYVTFWIENKEYKGILEHMRIDWNRLTKIEQIPLKRAYEVSSRYCTLIIVLVYAFGIVSVIIYILPKSLIVITASNASRSFIPFIMTEYFVDNEKYFFAISIHVSLSVLLGSTVLVRTDCVNTVIQMHISGIFQVIGFLLMHMFDKPEITNQKTDETLVHYERLLRIVDLHKRNLKLCHTFKFCMRMSAVIQMILAILITTSILLKLKNLTSPMQDILVVITYMFSFCISCIITYLSLLPGQHVYENSNNMFFKAHCGYWYTAPMKSQKLLLFLMQRFMTPFEFEVKNILSVTVKTFALIVRCSFSYFMALRSVEK